MVQGGDPTGTGRGGPGYDFEDEFNNNPLVHERGVISMAKRRARTQTEVNFSSRTTLNLIFNGRHTVFGKVTKGQDVVDAVRQGDTMQVTVQRIVTSTISYEFNSNSVHPESYWHQLGFAAWITRAANPSFCPFHDKPL